MSEGCNLNFPKQGYALWIPEKSPTGQSVSIEVSENEGIHKIHAEAPDQHELYFEVVAYPNLRDHADQIKMMKSFLVEEAPAGTQTSPKKGLVGRFFGTTFDFSGQLQGRWKERRFLWVDEGKRTFRIIHDHTSQLNRNILASLVWLSDDPLKSS